MLNRQYYEGYEGEGEVKIWYEDGQDENGIVIWIGFWETILEGCYIPDYQSNGIIECYFNIYLLLQFPLSNNSICSYPSAIDLVHGHRRTGSRSHCGPVFFRFRMALVVGIPANAYPSVKYQIPFSHLINVQFAFTASLKVLEISRIM